MTHLSFFARLSTLMIHYRKKKLSRGGDLHGEEESEREKERGESTCSAGSGFYLWFVYLCTTQWFPAPIPCWRFTPNKRDVPNRRKCLSPVLSRDAGSHIGRQADVCFSPILSQCGHICTAHLTNPQSCLQESLSLTTCVPPAPHRCNTSPKIDFLILLQTQYVFIPVW